MNADPLRNADDLLSRIREMEDQGQVNEAIALAHEASGTFAGVYDWGAEVVRLEQEGKLARPYREGVEALAEGDTEDAVRLLGWVVGKAPRYREASRYLFWAVEGRDPYGVTAPEPEAPPASLLRSGSSAWASPGVWLVIGLVGFAAFGAGWQLAPSAPPAEVAAAPAEVASPTAEIAAPPPPAPSAAPPPPAEAAPAPAAAPEAAAAAKAPRAHSAPATVSAPASEDQIAADCQSGDAHACFTSGDNLYFGRGVPRDLAGAARAYGRACDLQEPRGCYNAGDMADKGEASARDKKKAMSLFGRGCALGDAQSCSRKGFLEVETTEVP